MIVSKKMRNVGCCSHVTAIIWYLGYARYHPDELLKPRSITTKIDKCLRVIKKKKDLISLLL